MASSGVLKRQASFSERRRGLLALCEQHCNARTDLDAEAGVRGRLRARARTSLAASRAKRGPVLKKQAKSVFSLTTDLV